MTEHEPPFAPYWQDDLLLGEGRIRGERTSLRLRVHSAEERYSGRQELVRLTQPTGPRTYVHAEPYMLEPQISLTMDLAPHPSTLDQVGTVRASEWEGLRHRPIGVLQAWHYPTDQLLVIWEGVVFEPYAAADPQQDPTLTALWRSFEGLLRRRFPATRQIVTPSWEDLYEPAVWEAFLRARGYAPMNDRAFGKELESV